MKNRLFQTIKVLAGILRIDIQRPNYSSVIRFPASAQGVERVIPTSKE